MRKQVIAYLHTHWDREWYREFEIFRMRLLRVFDNVLEMLAKNKIPCFYFDGQVSALEDYLAMRPEREELVISLIRHKRLFIGPFYCLVDEFLTDQTCFRKNLEIGLKTAQKYGCKDFIGYLADTFGHSQNIVDVLRDFGIDKCMVWRGVNDFPSEFSWCGMDTINLVRGYFNDIFSLKTSIEKKAEILKNNLDKIAEKSGNVLLLPIGADHLGVETDINDQIEAVNEILKNDYFIRLGSPFDYFKRVENRFKDFVWNDELRDNSKTFTLQGCYSSRLDLKRENIECTYLLDLASRFVKQQKDNSYNTILEYAYKMLLQNQAHDSICGCSTDDVHAENKIRYKKIKQIANTIIDELKFKNHFEEKRILNLSGEACSGIIEFKTSRIIEGYDRIGFENGFDRYLLTDTQRIPVTEDYTKINTYLADVENLKPDEIEYIMPAINKSDLKITETRIENSNISLRIENGQIFINGIKFSLYDFADLGDSYNFGPQKDDYGTELHIIRSKPILKTASRVTLKIDFEGRWDVIPLFVSLDKNASHLHFRFDWINSQKNHLLQAVFNLSNPIREVFSEDMNILIKRNFNPEYDIRQNLPENRGIEVKNNTAPMQRGLLIDEEGNNLGIITKGLTQYEVFQNKLFLPILRSTGQISNPQNPARTTPAGPPIEVESLQQIGRNTAEFYVFFGNDNAFKDVLNHVYNYIVV